MMDTLLPEIACLSADLIFLGIFYKFYRKKLSDVKQLKETPELELDYKLKKNLLELENHVVPYAVVRGLVQSSNRPIPSQHVPGIAGVIQEASVVEHKVRWNPLMRLWSETEVEVHSFKQTVPFYITGGSSWNKITIEVIEPKTADGLLLSTVYNKFTPSTETFGGYLMGWIHGERSKGFQVREQMLVEGSLLTGIGQVFLEDNQIKLRSSELGYYLTPLTKEGLVQKMEEDVRFYRIFTTVFTCLGAYILFHVARSWYRERRRKIRDEMERVRREEVRRQRRRMARDSNDTRDRSEDGSSPMCTVCLTNPVEVLIMDCGHVCLCMDCADQPEVSRCPVCRSPIIRTVTAFLP